MHSVAFNNVFMIAKMSSMCVTIFFSVVCLFSGVWMTPLLDYYASKQLLHPTYEPAGQTVCGVGCHSGVASSVHEPRVSGSFQEVVLAESTTFRTPGNHNLPSRMLHNVTTSEPCPESTCTVMRESRIFQRQHGVQTRAVLQLNTQTKSQNQFVLCHNRKLERIFLKMKQQPRWTLF